MTELPYQILRPVRQDTAVVFASPHSGRRYSGEFLKQTVLDEHAIRSSEDAFVDMLFQDAADFGAPFIHSRTPRAYVDLNRSADELDGALLHNVPKTRSNPRVASGLGVIPRVVARGQAIYRGKLQKSVAQHRLDACWHPYHNALSDLLAETADLYDRAILIDCHSMPHEALDSLSHSGAKRPDIVIGDRFGSSCAPHITTRVAEAFRAKGFTVSHNLPFAGAYIVQHYGRPSLHRHALQIEIDRRLYMDEVTIQPNADFKSFRGTLNDIIKEITAIGRSNQSLLAAE
ncbi:N-formylglutamate amidohydrolase [Thalassobius sp. I31.1]|uniref:N-formylglutamate amidohydrolase n=1 Tax=Thalassobius sp. I31.1 TaxID=2109912 RepID=UPI000D1B1CA3|nr:N-formylglutamate amidohydrolase [Thalassobius sp. I31.1]